MLDSVCGTNISSFSWHLLQALKSESDGCFPSSPYLCTLLCVCVSLPVCVCVPFINVTGYLLIE